MVRDFNVTVPGGTVVALVGRSGAGKTTVTDLVARFHDPTRGRILLNGTDIRDFRLHTYRDLLAIVQQDVFLFDGSVRDNIAYGRHDATDAEIEDAARRANAHEFIVKLPEQYETIIGERGVKLSGGQQQRLAIARAILASPQILILDEATSNLDTESEQLIQASMATLLAGRTTFVIAHRLSTIRRADLILLMEDGRVIERGTHEELMSARGVYHGMVLRQMESHGETVDAAWSREITEMTERTGLHRATEERRSNGSGTTVRPASRSDAREAERMRVHEPEHVCGWFAHTIRSVRASRAASRPGPVELPLLRSTSVAPFLRVIPFAPYPPFPLSPSRHERLLVPDWLEPMAATLTQERFTGPEWIFERKFDGIRLLAFKHGAGRAAALAQPAAAAALPGRRRGDRGAAGRTT